LFELYIKFFFFSFSFFFFLFFFFSFPLHPSSIPLLLFQYFLAWWPHVNWSLTNGGNMGKRWKFLIFLADNLIVDIHTGITDKQVKIFGVILRCCFHVGSFLTILYLLSLLAMRNLYWYWIIKDKRLSSHFVYDWQKLVWNKSNKMSSIVTHLYVQMPLALGLVCPFSVSFSNPFCAINTTLIHVICLSAISCISYVHLI